MSAKADLEMIERSLSEIFQVLGSSSTRPIQDASLIKFFESINYSLLNGGKRFRPSLVLSVAESYQKNKSDFLPFALAVELIHTYSLVHDDLPTMDNDSERRGKATNHVVYGECSALLAGDALLTEAFGFLARSYSLKPTIAVELVLLLSEAAGVRGMIGGQVLDMMTPQFSKPEQIVAMHEMKTGALIRVAIEGAALIALEQASPETKNTMQSLWKEFGRLLGLSFQIADDILDFDQQTKDHKNLVTLISLEKTQQQLQEVSKQSRAILEKISSSQNLNTQNLIELVEFNHNRKS